MKALKENLGVKIVFSMVLGLCVGILISFLPETLIAEDVKHSWGEWFALPGKVFLGIIQMVVIPLVSSSIILGITSHGDSKEVRRIAYIIFPYFFFTTTIAVTLGTFLAVFIEPGSYIDPALLEGLAAPDLTAKKAVTDISIPQRIAMLIPTNISKTILDQDLLAIVVGAVLVGAAVVSSVPTKVKGLVEFIEGVQEVSLVLISWAMKIAPIAVFGLLCDVSIRVGVSTILAMGVYVFSVVLGLFSVVILYLLILSVYCKVNPAKFLSKIREVQLLAFSTSSSAAVIPVSMEVAKSKLNVRDEVPNFVIPVGATVNMDGTALYQVVAAVFLSQIYHIDLTTIEFVLLIVTTVGASIGTPCTPGVGIVVLATVLEGIGVPLSGIALIIGVDRILDMLRTTVNVTGDLTACLVVDKVLDSSFFSRE